MKIFVSLFGSKNDVLNWSRLLEQEKIPFKYKGVNLRNFSQINILVGFSANAFKKITQDKHRFCMKYNKFFNPTKEDLLKAFKFVNTPYIHPWYYPVPTKTIFLFRQDIDYVHPKGMMNLLDISRNFDIRGTYFLNISGEEEFDEAIGHLKLKFPTTPERKDIIQKILNTGNEIANHGYWHYVFNNFKDNDKNIKKCRDYLKNLFDIRDKGFASPGGEWNEALARAVVKNNFLYSCHTVSKEGELPFYEVYNKKVLEIPFSEICDANYEHTLKSQINSRKFNKISAILRKAYIEYIKKRLIDNNPIAIFGHPHLLGKIAKLVLPPIFREMSRLKIPNYTLAEFTEWWRKREKFKITYKIKKNKIILNSNFSGWIEIILKNKKLLLKINKKLVLNYL